MPSTYFNGFTPECQGCLKRTHSVETMEAFESLQRDAVPWDANEQPPVTQWSASFEAWLKAEGDRLDGIRETSSLNPWDILKFLSDEDAPDKTLYQNQRSMPACAGFAQGHAHSSRVLIQCALGSEQKFSAINPFVTWQQSKNDSISGGQSIDAIAKASNEYGQYTIETVGPYECARVRNYKKYSEEAAKHQDGIVQLPGSGASDFVDQIVACVRAGLTINIGNSMAVSGCTTDSHDIKVSRLGGRWAHATAFCSYRKYKSVEYVAWVNSHGDIYESSDEEEPGCVCWMDRNTLKSFVSSAGSYGVVAVTYAEAHKGKTLTGLTLPRVEYSAGWRR